MNVDTTSNKNGPRTTPRYQESSKEPEVTAENEDKSSSIKAIPATQETSKEQELTEQDVDNRSSIRTTEAHFTTSTKQASKGKRKEQLA